MQGGGRGDWQEQSTSPCRIAHLLAGGTWSPPGPGPCPNSNPLPPPPMPGCPSSKLGPAPSTDKMQRLCVHVLILALALAAFSEASWKPRSQLPDAPSGPGAKRALEARWLDQLGPAPHHQRQLRFPDAPHPVAGRSCGQPSLLASPSPFGPWPQSLGLGVCPHPHHLSHLWPAERAKKQGPWLEEEEEAYGWMDFGRRSAEEGDQQP